MAIPYHLQYIEAKLTALKSKGEQLNYLHDYLFSLKKQKAEFNCSDLRNLERLKIKTSSDYEIYMSEFEKGGLIYFNKDQNSNEHIYKRLGFENMTLLQKRLGLESTLASLNSRIEIFEALIIKVEALPPQQTETRKLTAPVLGLFCGLINKIGIDKKEEKESATIYCKRICVKYKLHYTDRVRQNYNVNEIKKLIQELTEKVLPLIDTETKSLIQQYLDSKHPTKQNLYA